MGEKRYMGQMRALLYWLNVGIYRYVGDRSNWELYSSFYGWGGVGRGVFSLENPLNVQETSTKSTITFLFCKTFESDRKKFV